MTDHEDDLLERLAALEREQRDARPPAWEALARGELEPEAVEDEQARAVFEPLPAEFEASLVDALTASAEQEAAPSARVIPFPAIVGTVLVIAAALVLWVVNRPPPAPPLPTYDAWVEADAEVRGSDFPKLRPGATFSVFMRPNAPVEQKVTAWVCVQAGDEDPRRITGKQAVHGEVVKFDATLPDDLSPGYVEIVSFVVGDASGIEPSCTRRPGPIAQVSTRIEVIDAPDPT